MAHQWLRHFQCLLAMPKGAFPPWRLWMLMAQVLWASSPPQPENKGSQLMLSSCNLPRSGLVQQLFGRIRLSRTKGLGCPPKTQNSSG
jgi:hypothetical protein